MKAQTWLINIPEPECERLLAQATLGRLGVIVDGRPEIYPVNHVYDQETGCVQFPTNSGTKLHGALHWPWVAFEVDGTEPDGSAGWSVLVTGRAEELTDRHAIVRATNRRSALWRSESALRWIRIVPERMTGRRITAIKY